MHTEPQHAASSSLSGNGNGNAALEDEEHDYEALPIGHGWATNMAAGALAGISEHAAIFPVDSIKVCMFACGGQAVRVWRMEASWRMMGGKEYQVRAKGRGCDARIAGGGWSHDGRSSGHLLWKKFNVAS